jgi:pyruvate dehydrogenase E2 component (dihydrolipoamide acetyltransferase)
VTDVLMPALSPTMEEGTLAKWHVKVGDEVKSGDVIAEIETDKATMEVEAVDEGVVEALLVPEGTEEVKVNTPIARLKGDGDATSQDTAGRQAGPPPAKSEPPPSRARTEPRSRPETTAAPNKGRPTPPDAPRPDGGRLFASPLARRLAKDAGIDLAQVKGSGPHGRIIQRDLEGVKSGATTGRPGVVGQAPEAAPAMVVSLEQQGIAPGSYDLVPLDSMKKTIARRMTASFRDVPHFPLTIDLEIDALLSARAKLNALLEREGVKASVNDLVIKAAAIALIRAPDANASYTPQGIARHHHADIAVAVAVDGGLITPIVRQAEAKGVGQIAREMKDLAERARARKLRPEEFQGGTFSISNLGMYGIRSFASIINEPHGAILSVGAGEKRPVVHGGELAVATVMSVTLTCDHRVVDGAIGARFLSAFKALVEDPVTMIA